jgi:hypothetical protein
MSPVLALAGLAEPDRIDTAVHEAGHAVTAILAGFSVRYATLHPRNRDYAGMVVLHDRRRWPRQESLAISCAGMIAQDVAGTDERRSITELSDQGDILAIREYARRWHASTDDGATVLDLIARSWELAFDLVVENYGAVIAVAERLLTSRRAVTGTQIHTCMASAPTIRPDEVPTDARQFWVPDYSALRSWKPAASRRKRTPAAQSS